MPLITRPMPVPLGCTSMMNVIDNWLSCKCCVETILILRQSTPRTGGMKPRQVSRLPITGIMLSSETSEFNVIDFLVRVLRCAYFYWHTRALLARRHKWLTPAGVETQVCWAQVHHLNYWATAAPFPITGIVQKITFWITKPVMMICRTGILCVYLFIYWTKLIKVA